MAKVSVNNDPLLERLIFGYDGTNYRVVKVDAEGNLVIAVKIDQSVRAKGYGWVGSAWHKNPLVIGYSYTISESIQPETVSEGENVLASTPVPEGEIWRVEVISASDLTSVPTNVQLRVISGGVLITLLTNTTPAVGVWDTLVASMTLRQGDTVGVRFAGITADDDIRLNYCGYKIDIDQ